LRALTVVPHEAGSARLEEVDEPRAADGRILVEGLVVGVCGTDLEIVAGDYGWAPPGARRLILGHESLGRVLDAPAGTGLGPGDLVVGIVRHADPVPCASCAAGEWDFCRNGRYTEHGIKARDGFCAERYLLEPGHAVRVTPALGRLGVLVEPASVVAKAWEQALHVGSRAAWGADRVLVTGAGPIGLLMALAAAHHGAEVHVLDREASGPKPGLAEALGATYHTGMVADACEGPDVVFECTGDPSLVLEAAASVDPSGVVCCLGRSLDAGAAAAGRSVVLENRVIVGTVNANRRHYEAALDLLVRADRAWLGGLISRTVPLDRFGEAFVRRPDDIKVLLEVGQ
jgi:threonine dehydrogenase-like Zn-dependent dehydrogenase